MDGFQKRPIFLQLRHQVAEATPGVERPGDLLGGGLPVLLAELVRPFQELIVQPVTLP